MTDAEILASIKRPNIHIMLRLNTEGDNTNMRYPVEVVITFKDKTTAVPTGVEMDEYTFEKMSQGAYLPGDSDYPAFMEVLRVVNDVHDYIGGTHIFQTDPLLTELVADDNFPFFSTTVVAPTVSSKVNYKF